MTDRLKHVIDALTAELNTAIKARAVAEQEINRLTGALDALTGQDQSAPAKARAARPTVPAARPGQSAAPKATTTTGGTSAGRPSKTKNVGSASKPEPKPAKTTREKLCPKCGPVQVAWGEKKCPSCGQQVKYKHL